MIKILVCDTTIAAQMQEIRSRVSHTAEWKICDDASPASIAREIADATIYVSGVWTREIARAARALEFVQVPGAGLDGMDLNAAAPNVVFANTYNHERSIAEYVLMVMLALARRLLPTDAALRKGVWSASSGSDSTPQTLSTLEGKTIGLVGFGHIGKQVARLAASLRLKTIAIKRKPAPELAAAYGLDFLGGPDDLPELLQRSDFLILAAPLTSSTRHLITAALLEMLKPNAFLINVARADLVDENALYQVLATRRIAGAALDVWYNYPTDDSPTLPAHLPFHQLGNVILTPHYSGATDATRRGRIEDVAVNIQNWLDGKPLRNIVARNVADLP